MAREKLFWTLVARVGNEKFRINDAYTESDMPILARGVQDFRAELVKLEGGEEARIVKQTVTEREFWRSFARIREDGVMSKVE